MLDIKYIRENPEAVRRAIAQKGATVDLDNLLILDQRLRSISRQMNDLKARKNELSSLFPTAIPGEREGLSRESRAIGSELAKLEAERSSLESALRDIALTVPAIPDPCAPVGPDASYNRVIKKVGEVPRFEFEPLDHVDILVRRDWADLRSPADISGSRTYMLKGDLVWLEHALIGYAFSVLQGEGFKLVTVPPFARKPAFEGTGHFPMAKDDAYALPRDDLYLIGTSEVVLNALNANKILDEAELPLLYAGYSGCYRREAGSSGRDVRGLLRVHHFTKVEQFVVCRNDPEESARWHEKLLGIAERILQDLELPYQIVECSTGDMGLGKFRMHDIETWVPSLGTYRETHSCSTLHDWQSRRTNTRYRSGAGGAVAFAHTLNNTAVASPRIFAPLLEVHQCADARIKIPRALQPFMNGRELL
jgi:seryl-tRNA synthetase